MRSSMTVVASALAVVVASGTAVLALPAPPAGPALPAAPLAAPDAPARVLPLPKASATPAAIDILPLDQVRPGMVGVGRTVFEGTKIEEFKVTVIGVLENVGPKQSMIIARLDGGPLEKTGIIAGMSGSPVYIDGKPLTPISVPLTFRGSDPATFEWAKGVFSGMGFTPVMGTGGKGALPTASLPDLQPGGAVGISLIEGDMDLSATGTVTHIDQ